MKKLIVITTISAISLTGCAAPIDHTHDDIEIVKGNQSFLNQCEFISTVNETLIPDSVFEKMPYRAINVAREKTFEAGGDTFAYSQAFFNDQGNYVIKGAIMRCGDKK